ncbi:MAG TPA: hypothetical protein VEH84_01405 [Alphaproteobacteria bacterium]|nr:hypothetical protein [Alphaproteobacteria bacterium]
MAEYRDGPKGQQHLGETKTAASGEGVVTGRATFRPAVPGGAGGSADIRGPADASAGADAGPGVRADELDSRRSAERKAQEGARPTAQVYEAAHVFKGPGLRAADENYAPVTDDPFRNPRAQLPPHVQANTGATALERRADYDRAHGTQGGTGRRMGWGAIALFVLVLLVILAVLGSVLG